MKYKKLIIGITLLSAAIVVAGVWFANKQINAYFEAPLIDKTQLFTLESGSNFSTLGNSLSKDGIVASLTWWKVIAKLHPELTKIKSGTYEFENGFSLHDILNTLTTGKEFQFKLTLVEGGTFKDWLHLLANEKSLKALNKTEQALIASLGIHHKKMEGLLHPETYYYSKGMSAFSVIKKAYKHQQSILNDMWKNRDKGLPYKTPYEALIMASIVEKESGHSADRANISSVFVNRLRMNMRLQTDPTVIYGMGDRYKGRIRTKDLRQQTKYNTYRIYGLPPTPIAMPSQEAIYAALHPAKSKYLYFVSKGNGKSYFSKNLKEHNRAVKKYILGK